MPQSLSNTYDPLLAPVAKTLCVFDLQMDGSSKRGGICATIHRTPPNVKDHAFLMGPLIENERDNLGRGPRGGPIQTESPSVGGMLEDMKQ
jgi:hypothetical protein